MTSRNGARAVSLSAAPACRNRSSACVMASSRPKKTLPRSASNADETGKGRAVEHAVPHRALRQETVARQPLAQAILDLEREIVCRCVVLECRNELAAAGSEPGVEEALEALPLRLDLHSVRRIERHRRGVRVAKNINIRQVLAGLSRVDRRQHLIGGAARIGFARRQSPGSRPGAWCPAGRGRRQ